MPPDDKVAVCLTCGNEWEVRTAGTGKKRKCPVCGKYRVKMRSELKEAENEPNSDSKAPDRGAPDNAPVAATPPDLRVDDATSDGVVERGQKRENPTPPVADVPKSAVSPPESAAASGGAGFGLLLLLAGAGIAVSFLLSRGRRGRRGRAAEVEHYERIPAYPGF